MKNTTELIVFIVGKMVPENLRYYLELGYKVVFLADSRLKTHYESITDCDVFVAEFTSKDAFLNSVRALNIPYTPNVLVTFFENYVLAKTWLGEVYQISTSSEESALAVTDKYVMRQKFMEQYPEITPDFAVLNSEDDLLSFVKTHEFPLMLKPANLFKSLLITKNENLDELFENYRIMTQEIERIYEKYHVRTTESKIIIEECLVGSFHSIEVFADQNGEVRSVEEPVDLIFAPSLGVNDNYNYSRKLPSALSDEDRLLLIEAAKKAAKSLNLIASPGHVELVMTKDGAKVIEIGSRLGGYRSRMYYLASGINLIDAEVKSNMGLPFDLNSKYERYCAVYELFPDTRGKLSHIECIDEVDELESFYYKSVKANVGDEIGLAGHGFKAVAVIFLRHSNKVQFEKECKFVEDNLKVRVV